MRTQLFYLLGALLLAVGLGTAFYLEFGTKTENKFVSFNDGSIDCHTIEIKKGMNKEELAQALKIGSAYVTGEIGNKPGCINYEFIREEA